MTALDILEESIAREFPKFKVVKKSDSWLMKAIGAVLFVCTLGKQRTFMTDYYTTIGYTVYVPANWETTPEVSRIIMLRHERVHMRQRAKYGMFLFTLLYVFLPLPGGLAYFRYKFEAEAYEETTRAVVELQPDGLQEVRSPEYRAIITGEFLTAGYFWMWPFKKTINVWYDGVLSRLPSRGGRA